MSLLSERCMRRARPGSSHVDMLLNKENPEAELAASGTTRGEMVMIYVPRRLDKMDETKLPSDTMRSLCC